MLGFRGCRLAIRYPEITEMQARAIFEAAVAVAKKSGRAVKPEIMIPLVAYRREFDILADVIRKTAEAVEKETGAKLAFEIGTMIELPRAALKADELAEGEAARSSSHSAPTISRRRASGSSRDDAAPILTNYAGRGIFEQDPFVSIDQGGVGELVEMGVARGRKAKPNLKIGICGEHGGDPASVAFFHAAGLDYVSCSPFRVPIARLAAAQAAIQGKAVGLRERSSRGREFFPIERIELGLARTRSLELRHDDEPEHERRHQEAPRHPEGIVAVLPAGDETGEHRCSDGDQAPDHDTVDHLSSLLGREASECGLPASPRCVRARAISSRPRGAIYNSRINAG